MSGSPSSNLLVPINIDALAVGTSIGKWASLAPNFQNNLANGSVLGYQQVPPPEGIWNFGSSLHAPGIHLRWALPDGLTHATVPRGSDGSPDSGNAPAYPPVPNRWLVIRMQNDAGSSPSAPELKAWIVESDTVNAKPSTNDPDSAAQWPVLPQSTTHALPVGDSVVFVGRSIEFSKWPGSSGGKSLKDLIGQPLTAVGYGEPTFAAHYQSSQGIFGFHDNSLDDTPGSFTYFASGWYSDSSDDPLHDLDTIEAWEAAMNELSWTWPGAIDGSPNTPNPLPNRTICHGLVAGIQWQGKNTVYPPSLPNESKLQIGIGNTALEALAAIIGQNIHKKNPQIDPDAVSDLIIAFQLDLLSEYENGSGQTQFKRVLEKALRDSSFASHPGGSIWIIEKKRSEANVPNDELPGNGNLPPAIPFPEPLGDLLQQINQSQSQLDNSKRLLQSTQREYFKAWHLNADGITVTDPVFTQLAQELDTHSIDIANHQDEVDRLHGLIGTALPNLLPDYHCKAIAAPRFWQAEDPVILVAGAGRTYRHGEDGRFTQQSEIVGSPGGDPYRSEPGKLLCRTDSEVLGGMHVRPNGGNEVTLLVSDFHIDFPAHGPGAESPPDFDTVIEPSLLSLLLEATLLDPLAVDYLANFVAGHAGVPLSVLKDSILEQQAIQWNAQKGQAVPDFDNFINTAPSQAAVTYWTDEQGQPGNPWIPLTLLWQAQFQPSYESYKGIPQALDNWKFDGIDYQRDPSLAPGKQYSYNGSTFVTPSAVWNLEQRVFKYISEQQGHGDLDLLEKILGQLQTLDILSQSAGTLSPNQGMQQTELQIPPLRFDIQSLTLSLASPYGRHPSESIVQLVEGNFETGPLPNLGTFLNPATPSSDTWFFPLRSGGLNLSNFALLDAYGQVLNPQIMPEVILAKGIKSQSGSPDVAEIRPRLAQSSRLDFRFVSATDDRVETDSNPSTSPVIGWIWSNHLDHSLLLSTASGRLIGKFRLSADQSEILWEPDPRVDPSSPISHVSENPDLIAFQDGLLAQSGESFTEFLEYLQQAQEQIDVPGSQQNNSAALLMGPPIALVRASLKLLIDGLPLYDQSKDAAGKFDDRGYTKIPFNIALGDLELPDDGLYGYFSTQGAPNDYERFYTAQGAKPGHISGPYVNIVDANDSPIKLTLQAEASPQSPEYVTLLMDPRVAVSAQSGILPAKQITAPTQDIEALLASHEIFFQVAPIISSEGAFSMPRPSEDFGTWNWLYKSGQYNEKKKWSSDWEERADFKQQTASSTLPPYPLALQEGWLRLDTPGSSGASIVSFLVLGGRYHVNPSEEIRLAWSALQPDGYHLILADDQGHSTTVPSASASYPVTINANTRFTLSLVDSSGGIADSKSFNVFTQTSP